MLTGYRTYIVIVVGFIYGMLAAFGVTPESLGIPLQEEVADAINAVIIFVVAIATFIYHKLHKPKTVPPPE